MITYYAVRTGEDDIPVLVCLGYSVKHTTNIAKFKLKYEFGDQWNEKFSETVIGPREWINDHAVWALPLLEQEDFACSFCIKCGSHDFLHNEDGSCLEE